MTTAFDIIKTVIEILDETRRGNATGGSTSTLVDSSCSEPNDWFNGGMLMIHSGTHINNILTISDYASATFTFTFTPTLGSAIGAATLYTATKGKFKKNDIIDAINLALIEIGVYTKVNTELVSLADTEEYTLPDGVNRVARVRLAANDVEPYEWEAPLHNWREYSGSLHFSKPFDEVGMPIRLYYNDFHDVIADESGEIDAAIPTNRLIYETCFQALRMKANYEKSEESRTIMNEIDQQRQLLARKQQVFKLRPDAIFPEF